jgi:hypothetical protein
MGADQRTLADPAEPPQRRQHQGIPTPPRTEAVFRGVRLGSYMIRTTKFQDQTPRLPERQSNHAKAAAVVKPTPPSMARFFEVFTKKPIEQNIISQFRLHNS